MSYFLKNRMFPRSRGLLFSLKASVKALTACWYHSSCLVFREVTARNDSILEKVVVLAFFFFSTSHTSEWIGTRDRCSGEWSRLVVRRKFFFFRARRERSADPLRWMNVANASQAQPSQEKKQQKTQKHGEKKNKSDEYSWAIDQLKWSTIETLFRHRSLRDCYATILHNVGCFTWRLGLCEWAESDWLTASSLPPVSPF